MESAGQVLYALGDLYHHPVEVERPEWGVHWAGPASTAKSRVALTAAALAEGALLVAAHIGGLAGYGQRLRATDGKRRTCPCGHHTFRAAGNSSRPSRLTAIARKRRSAHSRCI